MQRATRGIRAAACALSAAIVVCGLTAHAAIVDVALYELGEPGTMVGGNPQDSVGGHHFQNTFGTQTVIAPGAFFASTAANNYAPIGGSFFTAGGTTIIPTDNFAIELWARTSDIGQNNSTLFTTGSANNSLAFNLTAGEWRASLFNVAFFDTGVNAVVDEWVNLALIRENGLTTFYVDGVAQGTPVATLPVIDPATFHIGVTPGGAFGFNGDLDNLRIFTFDPNTDDPVAALTVNQVPEPASIALWALLGMAAAGFAWQRRRRLARS